ncbi:MAG: BcsE family c-di-GMP-binding protein, partial [Shewanella sp.]
MRNKFQLAIDALPVHFTQLREGGIYWLTVDDEAVADLLLVSFIQGLLPDSRYFLTSSLPMTEALQSALHHPQVRGELFALTQDPQGEWLRRLPAEMEWFGISKAADLLVVRYRCDGLEK